VNNIRFGAHLLRSEDRHRIDSGTPACWDITCEEGHHAEQQSAGSENCGSAGLTLNNHDVSSRVSANALPAPSAIPDAARTNAITSRTTADACAPSAILTPISGVRCATL